jgi:hypothetical protein
MQETRGEFESLLSLQRAKVHNLVNPSIAAWVTKWYLFILWWPSKCHRWWGATWHIVFSTFHGFWFSLLLVAPQDLLCLENLVNVVLVPSIHQLSSNHSPCTLYYERKEESPEVTMGLNDSSLSYYYICGYRRYKACGREIIYGLR